MIDKISQLLLHNISEETTMKKYISLMSVAFALVIASLSLVVKSG